MFIYVYFLYANVQQKNLHMNIFSEEIIYMNDLNVHTIDLPNVI